MKCCLEPKSWSSLPTINLLFKGSLSVPWNPCTFFPSHWEPAAHALFDAGIKLFQICDTMGLSPRPRGSAKVVEARLYVWPVFTSVRRPARRFAEGTFRLKVMELG